VPECPKLSGCPFFANKLTHMPTTAELTKQHYCLGDYTSCARFVVVKALGSGHTPDDLYPNQTDRAEGIVRTGGRVDR
jgi:hypothetical protein